MDFEATSRLVMLSRVRHHDESPNGPPVIDVMRITAYHGGEVTASYSGKKREFRILCGLSNHLLCRVSANQ
jgi:hypothetical protein